MKILSLLIVCMTITTSCSTKENSLVYSFINGDVANSAIEGTTMNSLAREITYYELLNLHDSNTEFILALGTPGCPACTDFGPILSEYIKNTNTLIYYWSVIPDAGLELISKYPDVYDLSLSTPSIYFIKGDQLILNSNRNFFNSSANLTNYMSTKVTEASIYSYSNQITFIDNLAKTTDEELIYFYDLDDVNSIELFNAHIMPLAKNSSKKLSLFEVSRLNDEEVGQLTSNFGLSEISNSTLYTWDNNINKSIDLNDASDAEIDEILNNLF